MEALKDKRFRKQGLRTFVTSLIVGFAIHGCAQSMERDTTPGPADAVDLLDSAFESVLDSGQKREAASEPLLDSGNTRESSIEPALDSGSSDGKVDTAVPLSDRVLWLNGMVRDWTPPLCEDGRQCPEGETCFRLTANIAWCDVSQPLSDATGCKAGVDGGWVIIEDECECEGRSCDADQVCRVVEQTVSGPPSFANQCIDSACRTPADCPEGSVCRPSSWILGATEKGSLAGRCLPAACQSDADCTLAPSGLCGIVFFLPMQGGEVSLTDIECFYAPDGDICPEGTTFLSNSPKICHEI